MSTRVKYDKLPDGAHTIIYEDNKDGLDPIDGMYPAKDVTSIKRNQIVEVEDLNDPKSRRARGVRQHLEGVGTKGALGYQAPLATVLEEKSGKKSGS